MTQKGVFGLNILGQGQSVDNSGADARLTGGSIHVVINEPKLAANIMAGGQEVIYRIKGSGIFNDDDFLSRNEAEVRQIVGTLHADCPAPAYLYIANEPGLVEDNGAINQEKVNKLVFLLTIAQDEAGKLNRKLCLMNTAVGHLKKGMAAALKPVSDRAKERGDIMAHHFYYSFAPFDPFNYKIGVWDALDVMDALGGDWVITEWGYAHKRNEWALNAIDGWKNHISPQEAIAHSEEFADTVLKPRGARAVFYVRWNDQDEQWRSFDTRGELTALIPAMNAKYQWSKPVTPAPVPVIPAVPKPENAGASIRARLVPKTGFTSVNVRVAPNVTAPLVSEWSRGLELLWYPATERSGTGYTWVWVEPVLAGQAGGWMARVHPTWEAQFEGAVTPPLPDVPVVAETPFYSQYGAGALLYTNDCGSASARMIIGWNFDDHGLPDLPAIRVDDVSKNAGKTYDGFLHISPLMNVLRAYGVDCYYTDQLSLALIEEEIRGGFPSIALINYRHILRRLDQRFTGGHFVVPVGYSRSSIFIHDPGWYAPRQMDGRFFEVPRIEFARAISDTASAGNNPNQGILIVHN